MITLGLYKDADIEAFKAELDAAGYAHKNGVSLKRFFTVFGVDKDSFSLVNHPSIEFLSEDMDKKLNASFVDVPVDYHYGGDSFLGYDGDTWALARICRRKNPFSRVGGKSKANRASFPYRYTRAGRGVLVYIADLGYAPNHPEFVGRISHLRPEFTGGYINSSGSSHGVHVASLAAGTNFGIAREAEIVFSPLGSSIISRALAALDDILTHYLADPAQRPGVINCSFAGPDDGSFAVIMADLMAAGLCITNSASNYREDHDDVGGLSLPVALSPCNIADVVVVGATAIHDTPMSHHRYGTAYGSNVKVFAPGEKVLGAGEEIEPNGYQIFNGTSMAAPHAAGVIACMLEGYQRPTSLAQVQAVTAKLIENSTKDILDFPESSGIEFRGNNRLVYLDPYVTIEPIPGLTPL